MKSITLPVPVFGLAVATRAALGLGIGLLIADRLTHEKRTAAGTVLVAIGALTTLPVVLAIRRSVRRRNGKMSAAGVGGFVAVPNGSMIPCSNCTIGSSPCAASGGTVGTIAQYWNSAWHCNR